MYSRYGKYATGRLPKERKTIALQGKGEDRGRYYRCWNCGAICDSRRERVDTSGRGRGGGTVDEYIDLSPSDGTDVALLAPTVESPWWNHETLWSTGPDGIGITPEYSREPDTFRGCWFCGCTTWRG